MKNELKHQGFGRVLIALYGILALAATSRGVFQIATKLQEAPLAYVLSLVSGIVYCLATFALARHGDQWHGFARTMILIELFGVVIVGLLSLYDAQAFPHDTVWSMFGRGYGFLPLILPLIGLWWLRKTADHRTLRANPLLGRT